MSEYLKRYIGVLTLHGPVFIGSGRELTKKEYVFTDNTRTEVGVLDVAEFYMLLKNKKLDQQYEDFLLRDKKRDLFSWLREVGISVREIKEAKCFKYTLPMGEPDSERAKWTVMETMKDPYGKPYIPGSSIKGMLRTVILTGRIASGELPREMICEFMDHVRKGSGGRNWFLRDDIRNIEAELFNTLNNNERKKEDAVNDSMSGIIVTDSRPVKTSDLVLCPKVDSQTDGGDKKINILRECIKPGTEIKFGITIDETKCKETVTSIMSAVESFDKVYSECFLNAFKRHDNLPERAVFIGGGCGYVSKTIVYPMLGKQEGIKSVRTIFEKTNVPREHKHNRDVEYGAAPHILKETIIDGMHYQMGLCSLTIKERKKKEV